MKANIAYLGYHSVEAVVLSVLALQLSNDGKTIVVVGYDNNNVFRQIPMNKVIKWEDL